MAADVGRVKKVVCITLNTAIDHVIEVEHLVAGSTIRADANAHAPAGKGVVVAVGVAILGGLAVATGFIGRESREIFAVLDAEQVEPMFLEVPGATRTNVTILEHGGRETHLQTMGYRISIEDVHRLISLVEGIVSPGAVVVLGGSLPPGAPEGLTAQLVALCRGMGAYVILDSSGVALLDGLRAGPQMVKPNLRELAEILGRTLDDSDNSVARAAHDCLSLGVTRVVVSRGYRGIVVSEKGKTWKAWADIGRNQQTASVGSGDAVVAAFASSTLRDVGMEDAVRLAVACGAANLFTRLPGRFRMADVADVLPRVQIESIP